jgi:hypothetical protein
MDQAIAGKRSEGTKRRMILGSGPLVGAYPRAFVGEVATYATPDATVTAGVS